MAEPKLKNKQESKDKKNELKSTKKDLKVVEGKDEGSSSKLPLIICVTLVVGLFIYLLYSALHSKLMSFDERVIVVKSLISQHDKLFEGLEKVSGSEYSEKFYNYMIFLTENVREARYHIKKIFRENPDYEFEAKNLQLIGGYTKDDYKDNIKAKLYLVKNYQKYLKKAKEYHYGKKIFKKPIHYWVGRPARKK